MPSVEEHGEYDDHGIGGGDKCNCITWTIVILAGRCCYPRRVTLLLPSPINPHVRTQFTNTFAWHGRSSQERAMATQILFQDMGALLLLAKGDTRTGTFWGGSVSIFNFIYNQTGFFVLNSPPYLSIAHIRKQKPSFCSTGTGHWFGLLKCTISNEINQTHCAYCFFILRDFGQNCRTCVRCRGLEVARKERWGVRVELSEEMIMCRFFRT